MEIHSGDVRMADLGNEISDAAHKALTRGLEADFVCSILVGVAADYWQQCYETPVTELAGILEAKAKGSTHEPVDRHAPAPSDAAERVRKVLAEHWLTAIECDHDAKTDTPRCYCSVWRCPPQPSVGAAVQAWIDHVLEQRT